MFAQDNKNKGIASPSLSGLNTGLGGASSAINSLGSSAANVASGIVQSALGLKQGLFFSCQIGELPATFFDVVNFSLDESLSELYLLSLHVVCPSPDLPLENLLMQEASLTITRNGIPQRKIAGHIANIEQGHVGVRKTYYRLMIRPALWVLTLKQDSRIFHNMSVPDILAQLLQEHHVRSTPRFNEQHAVREYTTQKRETDYAFFCRLAAEEGITFWFVEDELILSDTCLQLEEAIGLSYNPHPEVNTQGDFIHHLAFSANMRPHVINNKDYVWQQPSASVNFNEAAEQKDSAHALYEVYDSYARFQEEPVAKRFTKFRLEAMRAEGLSASAQSNSIKLMPGQLLDLTLHPVMERNTRWQVVRISHHGQMPEASDEGNQSDGTFLTNTMTLISGYVPWRPPFQHKPIAEGDELATVVGPAGEEIYTNKYGAVKIHFHWNRYDPKDENASHWVRVANSWNGGKKFGFVAIPRIGQEVIVSYLNGDIDRPIIIGTTYTGADAMPLDLPNEKTRTSWRSSTHKGSGFNEISFDDDNGKEQLFMHAQKDMVTKVLNDRSTAVVRHHEEKIGKNKTVHVGKDLGLTVIENMTTTVVMNQTETVGINKTVTVTNNIQITAGDVIELKCGASLLRMDSSGKVTINGTEFKFEASGPVQISGNDIDLN